MFRLLGLRGASGQAKLLLPWSIAGLGAVFYWEKRHNLHKAAGATISYLIRNRRHKWLRTPLPRPVPHDCIEPDCQ